MLGIVRKEVAPHERGLVFVNGELRKVLRPGVHWVCVLFRHVTVQIAPLEQGEMAAAFLAGDITRVTEVHFEIVENRRVTFVYRNGNLESAMRLPYVSH